MCVVLVGLLYHNGMETPLTGGNGGYIDGHSTSNVYVVSSAHVDLLLLLLYNTILKFLLMSPSLSHPLSHPLCSLLTML